MTVYKMRKLLRDKLKVKEDLAPIDMQCYRPERPKGMHQTTYLKLRIELYHLQEEYHRQFMKTASRILGLLS